MKWSARSKCLSFWFYAWCICLDSGPYEIKLLLLGKEGKCLVFQDTYKGISLLGIYCWIVCEPFVCKQNCAEKAEDWCCWSRGGYGDEKHFILWLTWSGVKSLGLDINVWSKWDVTGYGSWFHADRWSGNCYLAVLWWYWFLSPTSINWFRLCSEIWFCGL